MGLFSSSSKSSSSSTTNNTSIDKRVVADNGSLAVSGDTVNVLDGGAIEQAFEFAKFFGQEASKSLAETLDFANEGVGAIAKAYDQARGDATQKNLIAAAALAAVVIVAVKVWGK